MSQQPLEVQDRKLSSCLRQEGLHIFRSFKGQPPDLFSWTIYPSEPMPKPGGLVFLHAQWQNNSPALLANSNAYPVAGEGSTCVKFSVNSKTKNNTWYQKKNSNVLSYLLFFFPPGNCINFTLFWNLNKAFHKFQVTSVARKNLSKPVMSRDMYMDFPHAIPA